MSLWPEQRWEPAKSPPLLGIGEMSALLSTMDLPRAVSVKPLPEGRTNANWAVELEGGEPVVVRFHEAERSNLGRLAWLAANLGDGLQVPKLLWAGGEELIGRPISVLSWIDGESGATLLVRHGAPILGDLGRGAGQALARISDAARFEAHGLLDDRGGLRRRFAGHRASLGDFVQWSIDAGRAGRRLGPELSRRLQDFIAEKAPLLDELDGHHRLVHGDFNLANLIYQKNADGWRVVGVVDWEFAMAGSPLFDVAVLTRYAPDWPSEFLDAFVGGYRSAGGELPPGWYEQARILDVRNFCGILNASQPRPMIFEQARQKIAEMLEYY